MTGKQPVEGTGTRGAAAAAAPRATGRRRLAGLIVVGGALAAAALAGRVALSRTGARMPSPPYVVPAPVVAAVHAVESAPAAGSVTIALYVTRTCPFCRAELAHWGSLAARSANLFRSVRVVVMTPDRPAAGDTLWIPPALPHLRLYDRDRSLARALGVRAVPVVLFVDDADTVRQATVGEHTPDASLHRLIALLQRSAPRTSARGGGS